LPPSALTALALILVRDMLAGARDDVLMSVGSVRDFDFHPDEDDVRVFTVEAAGVLRLDRDVFVSHARYDAAILWHYAFADHWFKVNLTTDLGGAVVETGGSEAADGFAVNCDLATPMWQQDMAVYAVDLFLDVLIRSDGRTYRVCDVDELAQAIAGGQISANEAAHAAHDLADLVTMTERGTLLPWLYEVHPYGPADPPAATAVERVGLEHIPQLQPGRRATWQKQ
jgi:hypothetical protein